MKAGVIVFPGSNCDKDTYRVLSNVIGAETRYLWHQDTQIDDLDLVVLPGGFSYGDYLRTGAIARFSPIMSSVKKFAANGGIVLGICNGFQMLLEARILPGVMIPNRSLRFICMQVYASVQRNDTCFTSLSNVGDVLEIPIAHFEGNFFAPNDILKDIEDNRQVVLRYSDAQGNVSDESNPNGSINNIAGLVNKAGNVLGMMPHPERSSEKILGSEYGRIIFESILHSILNSE